MKKIGIILISISVLLGSFWGVVNIIPAPKVENTPFVKQDRTLICAHRGGADLNPENTEMAFDYVINQTNYVDIVEFDVRLTEDKVPVIIHNELINSYALDDGFENVSIKDYKYSELLKYNLGYNFVDRNGNRPYKNISNDEAKEKGLTNVFD